ncbi:hypothetical protein [Enterobacter ludwigii]|uniref:hypothetical protein n=1 Tax=Enterobacter ludwigii TaxID=299767 RepID=UPI003976BB53
MNITEKNNTFHCDCGFSWQLGKSGSHNCGDGLRQQIRALVGENTSLKEVLEYAVNPDNAPEYHRAGMGCGVEDRGYQKDGYNACEYGWDSALDRMYSEVLPDVLPETPVTDAYLAEVRAQGVEMFSQFILRDACGDRESQRDIGEVLGAAKYFAAQLRKGVQS